MKLIDNWQSAWKWLSVNCMVVAAAIQGAWIYIPEDMRMDIPQHLVGIITIFLLILGVIGRLTKQVKRVGKEDVVEHPIVGQE